MTNLLPQNGQTVIFTRIPPGSCPTAGEAYRVDRPKNKGDFRFEPVERGSSAFDRPHFVSLSDWRLV